jgi:hypothetical protein
MANSPEIVMFESVYVWILSTRQKQVVRRVVPVFEAGVFSAFDQGGSVPPVSVALMPAKNSVIDVILFVRVSAMETFSGLDFGAGPCWAFIVICTLARPLRRFFSDRLSLRSCAFRRS